MALYRSEGVILRTRNLGEADKVVTILTPDQGKVEAVARGARRARSRLLGVSQPFVHATFDCYRNRQLDTLAQADVRDAFRPLREDLVRMAHASVATELVDVLTQMRDPNPRMYGLLLAGLHVMAAAPEPVLEITLWSFQLKLVCMAGFRPRLDACAACEGEAGRDVRFSCSLGGLLCSRCAGRDSAALPLGAEGAAWLRNLFAVEFIRIGELSVQRLPEAPARALSRYVEFVTERPLRSLSFLSTITQWPPAG